MWGEHRAGKARAVSPTSSSSTEAASEKTNTHELTGKGQGRKKGKVDYRKVGYRYRES